MLSIFISYEYGSKAYRTYDPTTRHVHVTQDVVFDEMPRGIGAVARSKGMRATMTICSH